MYPPAELAYMSQYGLGPFRALQAATSEAARLLGLADQIGTLEAGKQADLIAVSGDPLADPELWRDPARIVFVMQGGRVAADRRGA
jgi:imidazolonepropionase-like amidohydrolase